MRRMGPLSGTLTAMNRMIVANWKHNPATLEEALALGAGIAAIPVPDGSQVVACAPYPDLAPLIAANPGLTVGAQDLSTQPLGAHTGEVGAELLRGLGVTAVIIGHSERRAMGETDAEVGEKVRVAREAGLTPVMCVGEPREVREQGMDAVHEHLGAQLQAMPDGADAIVAYEPIWAIGSGTADDPASAAEVAAWIAGYLAPRVARVMVLYGGSATPDNAAAFLAQPAIGGLLVGGASLDAAKFAGIVGALTPPAV